MSDRESRFEWCLNEIDAGRLTLDQCLRRFAAADPELASAVRTAYALRKISPPETRLAQARVRGQLMARLGDPAELSDLGGLADLASEHDNADAPTAILPMPPTPPTASWLAPRGAARRGGRALLRAAAIAAAIAAALLIVLGGLGWGLISASAATLPGDPLYGVKRAQESVMLATAVGDDGRGRALAAIADHRLTEASAEADRGNADQAQGLEREFASEIQQVIALSGGMQAKGQDTRAVLAALAAELARAVQVQVHAASHGQAAFAQALDADVQAATQAISEQHLRLPNSHAGNGQGKQPTKTPEPKQHPTPVHNDKTPTPHAGGDGGRGASGSGQ